MTLEGSSQTTSRAGGTDFCYCSWQDIDLTWYIVAGAITGSFPVYLIATGGWERLHDIWKRTKYNGKEES